MNAPTLTAAAALAVAIVAAICPVDGVAAPRGPGASPPSSGGNYRAPSGGNYRSGPQGHYRSPNHGHYRPGHSSGHWHAGARYGYGYGSSYWPGWGLYWSAPFLWGSYAYGYPGYWGPSYAYSAPYYPAYPAPYGPSGSMLPPEEMPPTTQVDPAGAGAPMERPLYFNYCESARAYYPKVTHCPEGWQVRRPEYN